MEGFVMNSQPTSGGRERRGAVRYEFITYRLRAEEVVKRYVMNS